MRLVDLHAFDPAARFSQARPTACNALVFVLDAPQVTRAREILATTEAQNTAAPPGVSWGCSFAASQYSDTDAALAICLFVQQRCRSLSCFHAVLASSARS